MHNHDLSRFVNGLGYDFLLAACNEVRRIKPSILQQTWISNYVSILVLLCESIIEFHSIAGQRLNFSGETDVAAWFEFSKWLHEKIEDQTCARLTKSKKIKSTDNLLFLLTSARIIPVSVSISPLKPRHRSKMGESRFTIPGWHIHAPSHKKPSPFSFEIVAHQRSYDFSKFENLGRLFVLGFVQALESYFARLTTGTAKKSFNVLVNFFNYILTTSDSRDGDRFREKLNSDDFRNITDFEWERVIYAWRDWHRIDANASGKARGLGTAHDNMRQFHNTWDAIASQDVVPPVTVVGYKNATKQSSSTPRKSLAQLTPLGVTEMEAARSAANSVSKYFDTADQQQVIDFISALSAEMPADELKKLSPGELVEKIQALNATRLQKMRQCAELDFLKWREHWKVGQRALCDSTISGAELVDLLDSPLRMVTEKRRNSKKLLQCENETIRLGNSLNLVLEVYDGLVSGIAGRYHHMKLRFGGAAAFSAYLHPHPEATVALWTMLLIDTGANCEVVREMPFNCVESTNDQGFRKVIFAPKGRADGKVIIDHLPVSPSEGQTISSVEALYMYTQMTSVYRSSAEGEFRDRLFIDNREQEIVGVQEWRMRDWFTDFLSRHLELSGFEARPSMIRPSVLMATQYASPEGVVAAQVVADHMSASTTILSYTGRMPAKLQNAQKIREFQERFQAVVIASIKGAASKLGLTGVQFERILSDAARTGLGVACLDPMAGIQAGTTIGTQCSKFESCPGCEMRWVIGTIENISDLILFNEHLRASQDEAIRLNSEQWERKWLPWLVFSDIALAKLSQGETALAFVDGTKLAGTRREKYRPLPLF